MTPNREFIAVMAGYQKTHPYLMNLYKQESATLHFIYSRVINSRYTVHLSLSGMYFWNDEAPFSLRLNPGNLDRYNMNFTMLHEGYLMNNFGVLAELGILGLNYSTQYLHYGFSFFAKFPHWLLQLGISHSLSPGRVISKSFNNEYYENNQAIHPEIQAQYFF